MGSKTINLNWEKIKMNEFKVGDIVQLKSGGPKMTIEEISEMDNSYCCKWFAGSKLQEGFFAASALIRVEEEDDQS